MNGLNGLVLCHPFLGFYDPKLYISAAHVSSQNTQSIFFQSLLIDCLLIIQMQDYSFYAKKIKPE